MSDCPAVYSKNQGSQSPDVSILTAGCRLYWSNSKLFLVSVDLFFLARPSCFRSASRSLNCKITEKFPFLLRKQNCEKLLQSLD